MFGPIIIQLLVGPKGSVIRFAFATFNFEAAFFSASPLEKKLFAEILTLPFGPPEEKNPFDFIFAPVV